MKKRQRKFQAIMLAVLLCFGLTLAANVALAQEATSPPDGAADTKTEDTKIPVPGLFPGELVGKGEAARIVDFRVFIRNFYFFSIGASILVATVMIMIGGMIWVTSAGNTTRVSTARDFITQAIIGVILLLGAYTILQVIRPSYVTLESPLLPELGTFVTCVSKDKICQPSEIKQCTGKDSALKGKPFPTADGKGLRPCCTSPEVQNDRSTKCGEGSVCATIDAQGKCIVGATEAKPLESVEGCPESTTLRKIFAGDSTETPSLKTDALRNMTIRCKQHCGECKFVLTGAIEVTAGDRTLFTKECTCTGLK